MRVAIIADPIDNQNAGIHVFTREMVKAMIRNNPGHELMLIREKRDPGLRDVKQIAIWNTRLPVGYASLRLFIIIPWILHKMKTDVVIEPAHFGPFNLSKKIRRVTIIHDLTAILFPKLHRWHSQLLQKIFLRGILKRTNLIVANSDHTAADICVVYPKECKKVKRIYPGVDEIFKPDTNKEIPGKYRIQKPYFLFVGTIEPRKNLLTLLEAFKILRMRSGTDVALVIAGGTGWKASGFFNKLKNHPYSNDIICTGFVEIEDLPALYTNAIAMVYPSLYEGFGLPILEALSCGTPVVASKNSSLPEAGGAACVYFDATNASELAAILNDLVTRPPHRESLKMTIHEHLKNFGWDLFATEMWKQVAP